MAKNIKSVHVFLLLIIIVYFIFGFNHITKFVYADEQYWKYERIPDYWDGILNWNLKKTHINDKPGVTLALVSGTGLIFEKNPASQIIKSDGPFETYDTNRTEKINLAFRLPILIANGLFLLYFFWIIKKIFNEWIALWSVIFMALSPVLIGISQIINPDSLLWSFSAAAIFSYLALLKTDQKKYLFLTIIFTGFSLLSKYTANILFPFFFLMLISKFIFWDKSQILDYVKSYKRQLIYYLIIFMGVLTVISIFMPSVFIKPKHLYELTLGFKKMKLIMSFIALSCFLIYLDLLYLKGKIMTKIKDFLRNKRRIFSIIFLLLLVILLILLIGRNFIPEKSWSLFKSVPFDTEKLNDLLKRNQSLDINIFEKLLLEFNPLVFSISPIAILAMLFLWIKSIIRNKYDELSFYIFFMSLFLIIYYWILSYLNLIATVRYSIMLYPIVAIFSGIGVYEIVSYFKKDSFRVAATLLILPILIISLYHISPFYFNYTNFLLPKKYIVNNASGYGGYEAAQYINSQIDSKNSIVWSDYYGVCPFINGNCLTKYKFDITKYPVDYYVFSNRGEERYKPDHIMWQNNRTDLVDAYKYYKKNDPIFEILIDNRPENYIRVFKSESKNE